MNESRNSAMRPATSRRWSGWHALPPQAGDRAAAREREIPSAQIHVKEQKRGKTARASTHGFLLLRDVEHGRCLARYGTLP